MNETEEEEWGEIKIPTDSTAGRLIRKYNQDTPPWKIIEQAVLLSDYVSGVGRIFPDKTGNMYYLKPLIYKILLGGKDLDDEYFEKLKKL